MSNSTSKGTALVTGASRGIGAVYADRLAKRGYDLILVARSEAPLKALTASLASASGRRIIPIVADLNNKIDLAKAETKLREDSSITMLVNNAGIGAVVPLLNGDIEKMEEMIALNSIALTRLTYAAAPAFVKRGMGTIINISSVVGISPETLNGVYGATKAYVLAFTHSLQHELADKGIRVQAVLPGATATDMWEIAGLPWQKLPPSIVMPVEDMVGPVSRPRAAPSHSASAIPYPRPDTGFRRGVRHDSPKWARSATKRALRNPGTCSLLGAIAFKN